MQPIPTSSLVVIQTTFLFGILVELLDHPTRMSHGDEPPNEVSGGSVLNQYLMVSAFCSDGSVPLGACSSFSSSGTERSANNQPSGPVCTRLWLLLCRGEPVVQCTRMATACTCIVPLVPSRHAMVRQADAGNASISSLTV